MEARECGDIQPVGWGEGGKKTVKSLLMVNGTLVQGTADKEMTLLDSGCLNSLTSEFLRDQQQTRPWPGSPPLEEEL